MAGGGGGGRRWWGGPRAGEVGMGVGELSLDMAELSDMDLTMLRTTLFLTVLWPWANPSAWSMIEIRLWLEAELSWRRRGG